MAAGPAKSAGDPIPDHYRTFGELIEPSGSAFPRHVRLARALARADRKTAVASTSIGGARTHKFFGAKCWGCPNFDVPWAYPHRDEVLEPLNQDVQCGG